MLSIVSSSSVRLPRLFESNRIGFRFFYSLMIGFACLAQLCSGQLENNVTVQAGIRKLDGKYLTLHTDLPSSPAIDELPQVFDKAVPQWCEYFSFPVERLDRWHQTGFLMKSVERFRSAGYLPDDLPPFLNGYQRGTEFWAFAQPSEYYTRHLVLHEGTHAFMFNHLNGGGSPWYSEGVAELLGSHHWENGELKMGWMPTSKTEVPYWGRIKIVKDELKQQRAKTLKQVFRFEQTRFQRNESYAWSWAASAFFDGHPKFKTRFRLLRDSVKLPSDQFLNKAESMFKLDQRQVSTAWQVFVTNLDYGYDVAEDEIHYIAPVADLPAKPVRVKIDSSKGWQSTGYLVQSGTKYRIRAKGLFTIRQQSQVWTCEPGGVTLSYHQGRPLGKLLVGVENEHGYKVSGLTQPKAIGLSGSFVPNESGTLFFRINEPAGQLGDNDGVISVLIGHDTRSP